MVRRVVSSFTVARQPLMARQSYANELVAAATFPVAVAMIEGAVVSVLGKLVFDLSPLGFATIFAAPMFANVTSLLWARLARGRRKITFICTLQVLLLVLLASIALLPTDGIGPAMLVAMVVVARCLMAGMVTVRSVVWRSNYRRPFRARITSKFVLIATAVIALAPLAGYKLLDLNPQLFRVLYPAAALIGVVGVIAFARIRLRQERSVLEYERSLNGAARQSERGAGEAETGANGVGNANAGPKPNVLSVLRDDPHFRAYMFWQFLAGLCNMMGEAAVVLALVTLCEELYPANKFSLSILLSATIPLAFVMLSLPLWAKLLDRVHIVEYRCWHGLCWIAAQFGNFAAVSLGILPLLAIPRLVQGISMGGGRLAWNIGHHDFADERLITLYTGIHQTLTGIRGAFGPYLGVLLYAGWESRSVVGYDIGGWTGIGANVFLITGVLAIVAQLGFFSLNVTLKRQAARAAAG